MMKKYDIAVVGTGPAGCMAAIKGAAHGKNVILLERNKEIGRKLLLTGNGRCNLTNTAPLNVFLEKFGKRGTFYRDAFTTFSNYDLMDFFKTNGLELKYEEGRVFPITDKSQSVVNVLRKVLDENNVEVLYNYRLKHLQKQNHIFKLFSNAHKLITARKVILATGGFSYGFTGSTGDSLNIVQSLGHQTALQKPGVVPLLTREKWTHRLKGITLENVGMSIRYADKKMDLSHGNLLLTHFGVSGPFILDMSGIIVQKLDEYGDLRLLIDFKPDINGEDLKNQFIDELVGKKILKNYLKDHLPQNMIEPVLDNISLDPQKKLNQITKNERMQLLETLKALPLTIIGHLPIDKAMVTCGGVFKKEIDPKTMESKLIKELYFAGELIEGCGRTGGFNIQQAFSTGFLAGYSASIE